MARLIFLYNESFRGNVRDDDARGLLSKVKYGCLSEKRSGHDRHLESFGMSAL